jgi:hypothetical protein
MISSTKGEVLDYLVTSGCGFSTLTLCEAARGPLTETLDPTKPIKTPFLKLQRALLQAPAISLPNLNDPFKIYVTKRREMALKVLGHRKDLIFAPVAYL